jgi:hypothetical protein
MSDLAIKKGTKCVLSELGHNNFLYPSTSYAINLNRIVFGKKMSWLGGGDSGLMPVSILTQAISNLLTSTSIQLLGDGTYSIVWVDPDACLVLKN